MRKDSQAWFGRIFAASIAATAVVGVVVAQTSAAPQATVAPAIPNGYGTMHLTSHVGSFRISSPGADLARGRIDIAFTGTVLISGLKLGSTVVASGSVRREYNDDKHNKQVWHGTGKLIIDGFFRGIQWFGRDLTSTYVGVGIVQLYGEFDKNLETGFYWYDDPTQKKFWSTFGQQLTNPETKAIGAGVKPHVRTKGGG